MRNAALEAVRKGFQGRTTLMSSFALSGAFTNKWYAFAFRPTGELASEASENSTIQNGSSGLLVQPLLRQMKRANNARCPQYMALYGAHNLTECETWATDMRYIRGIE